MTRSLVITAELIGRSCAPDEFAEQAAPLGVAALLFLAQAFVGGGAAPECEPYLPTVGDGIFCVQRRTGSA